jgi:hypothetical protein
MFAWSRPTLLRPNFFIPVVLLASAWQAQAAHWTLSSAGPPTWTYTLTFDPEDNYNLFQNPTTITMTGLTGVTAAGAPTSTDFPAGSLTTNNLAWTPQVLNGGTKVVWSNSIGGTGNFPVAKNVFGFSITAPTAVNGTVAFATSGVAQDTGTPNSRDVSGSVSGPAATGSVNTVPAAGPLTLVLLSFGLAATGAWQVKRRMYDTMLPRQ